jgi:photosystem II stability/assembly factor-like uncharacterized protein
MCRIRIGMVLFFALALAGCSKERIRVATFHAQPVPVQTDVMGLWFADSLNGIAVGGKVWESGFILSTLNGGSSWQLDTLLSNRLDAVSMSNDGQTFACGLDGRCLHRPPESPNWYVFRMDYAWLRDVAFIDSRYGVAVAGEGYASGRVYRYGPENFWELDTVLHFPNDLAAVWFSDSATVHAAGYGWVMRSADAGRHWERHAVTGDFFQDIHFPTPDTGYICGSSGAILKTTDAGRHWQQVRAGGSSGRRNARFQALWFATADRGYVVGDNGLFWRSEDGGNTWLPVEGVPAGDDFTDIHVVGKVGWLSAKNGRIYRFEE